MVVKVLTNGTFTNVASVNCTEEPTSQRDSDTVEAKYDVALDVTKSADVEETLVGDVVTFTITITNNGKSNATNVTVKDVLPNGLILVDGELDQVIPLLGAGESVNVTVKAKSTTYGEFINVVSVSCYENSTVISDNATVSAKYIISLNITKVADSYGYAIGDVVTFTINVTNNGPSNATNVTVEDALPDGLTLVEGNLTQVIPFLGSGESVNVIVKAKTTLKGNFTNVVSVFCNENTTKVSDKAEITVYNPYLEIVKTTNVTATNVGKLINFTIEVYNRGISEATGVAISDILDTSAFEIVESSGSYTISGDKLVWNVNSLSANDSCSVWIVVKALTNGTFVNTATVNCSEEGVLKQSSVNVTVFNPDISVIKVALDEFVYIGNQTKFNITVTNIGDIELTNVYVDDTIPEGLDYDHFIGTNWTNEGTRFTYNAPLAVGESIVLTIVVNANKAGNFTNVVVVGCAEGVTDTDNDSVIVYNPSLVVREISNDPLVIVGETVSFTVVVTNDGDCVLGDVYATNFIPDGLTYLRFEGDNWNKVGDKFVYNGVLNPGESVNYTLYFKTTKPGEFVPEVVAGSNLTSNATAKAYSSNVTNVINPTPNPSISVSKKIDTSSVVIGGKVKFTITVKNTGDCTVGDVFVIDALPAGLEFISFQGNGWSKDGNKYTYSGSLAPGESISFTVTCLAVKVGNWTNTVIAGCNMTENVTASADVEIKDVPPVPGNDTPVHKQTTRMHETGNPILLLILVFLALIPIQRRKH